MTRPRPSRRQALRTLSVARTVVASAAPDTMNTGIPESDESARIAAMHARPSITGNSRSRRIRSGRGSSRAISSAWAPSVATRTSQPSRRRMLSMRSAASVSSSARRTSGLRASFGRDDTLLRNAGAVPSVTERSGASRAKIFRRGRGPAPRRSHARAPPCGTSPCGTSPRPCHFPLPRRVTRQCCVPRCDATSRPPQPR